VFISVPSTEAAQSAFASVYLTEAEEGASTLIFHRICCT